MFFFCRNVLKLGKKYDKMRTQKEKLPNLETGYHRIIGENEQGKQYVAGCSLNERINGRIMCKAAEVGKIVVNKCLNLNYEINTQKLQKLLVLMQVECIRRTENPLFKEDVRVWNCGVAIKEVDDEFNNYGQGFSKNDYQEEFMSLLISEEEVVDYILDTYGKLDADELNNLPDNQKVIQLGVKGDNMSVPHINYQILMGAFSS